MKEAEEKKAKLEEEKIVLTAAKEEKAKEPVDLVIKATKGNAKKQSKAKKQPKSSMGATVERLAAQSLSQNKKLG